MASLAATTGQAQLEGCVAARSSHVAGRKRYSAGPRRSRVADDNAPLELSTSRCRWV